MRLTRWKLMAGVLGLSMCGIAALAEPACRTAGLTSRNDETSDEKPTEGAKPVPLPPVADVPPPVIPAVEDVKPIPVPEKNDPNLPPVMDQKLFEEIAKEQLQPVQLPTLPKGEEPATPPAAPPVPLPIPGPATPPIPPVESPPAPVSVPTPTPPAPVDPPPLIPAKGEVPAPVDVPVKNEGLLPSPAPQPAPAGVPEAAKTTGKQLKVLLHLSENKPWFEVKDGEDLVLKVTADAVELKASTDLNDANGGLKASGQVTFRTLGGYGTCDELRVVPGTGEVVVNGKVSVTSSWGRSETTATADKMTFRLGGDAKK